jgi:hypothetical protein
VSDAGVQRLKINAEVRGVTPAPRVVIDPLNVKVAGLILEILNLENRVKFSSPHAASLSF